MTLESPEIQKSDSGTEKLPLVNHWESANRYRNLKKEQEDGVEGEMTPEKNYYNLVKEIYELASTAGLPRSEVIDLLSGNGSFKEFLSQRDELRASGVSDAEIEKYNDLYTRMEERFMQLQKEAEEAGRYVHPDVREYIINDLNKMMYYQLDHQYYEKARRLIQGSLKKINVINEGGRRKTGVTKQHEAFTKAEEDRLAKYREEHQADFEEFDRLDTFLKQAVEEDRRIDDPEVEKATTRLISLDKQLDSAGFGSYTELPWHKLLYSLRNTEDDIKTQRYVIANAERKMHDLESRVQGIRQKMERIGLQEK